MNRYCLHIYPLQEVSNTYNNPSIFGVYFISVIVKSGNSNAMCLSRLVL